MPDIWRAARQGDGKRVRYHIHQGTPIDAQDAVGWTAVMYAARHNQMAVLQYLLSKGAEVNIVDKYGESALTWAAQENNWEAVKTLLASGADVRVSNEAGENVAHRAVMSKEAAVLEKVLMMGLNAREADKEGWTPLHWAARAGHLESVFLLIRANADPNALDGQRWTPLHWAAAGGHLECVEFLVKHGADERFRTSKGELPYDVAGSLEVKLYLREGDYLKYPRLRQGPAPAGVSGYVEAAKAPAAPKDTIFEAAKAGSIERVNKHLHEGVLVDATDEHGMTPLHYSAHNGHVFLTRFLIEEARADLDRTAKNELTPILLASGSQHWQIVRMLADRDVDINRRDHNMESPVQHTARFNHFETMRSLYMLGGAIDVIDKNKWTPLHWAAYHGNVQMIQFLLDNGLRVDPKDDDRNTPLHHAARQGHVPATTLLLDRHADWELRNRDNSRSVEVATPETLKAIQKRIFEMKFLEAARDGDLDLVRHFVTERKVNVDCTDKEENYAILYAVKNKHLDVVRYLAEVCEADPTKRNKQDKTALDYAATHDDPMYISYLAGAVKAGHDKAAARLADLYVQDLGQTSKQKVTYAADEDAYVYLRNTAEAEANGETGVKVNLVDFEWNPALIDYALHNHVPANMADSKGETMLYYAARAGDLSLVEKLLSMGASSSHRNLFGQTPIIYAANDLIQNRLSIAEKEGTIVVPVGLRAPGTLPVKFDIEKNLSPLPYYDEDPSLWTQSSKHRGAHKPRHDDVERDYEQEREQARLRRREDPRRVRRYNEEDWEHHIRSRERDVLSQSVRHARGDQEVARLLPDVHRSAKPSGEPRNNESRYDARNDSRVSVGRRGGAPVGESFRSSGGRGSSNYGDHSVSRVLVERVDRVDSRR